VVQAKMKAKAEEDRRLRLESERRQKEEAERLLQEIEFRKAFEQQEQRKTAEEKRKQQALDAEQRRWREEQVTSTCARRPQTTSHEFALPFLMITMAECTCSIGNVHCSAHV
jgi:hypothetical protein